MTYMLDTDTVSHLVRKHPPIIKKLIKHEDDEICISAITNAELFYGLEKKNSQRLFSEVRSIIGKCAIINFDASQSELYGKIRVELEKSGAPLGDMDLLIAAAAISTGAILVSHNTKHFSRVKGLKVEDWF
jgi:tRNA(fMet)-specific endonuclease VapC